MEPERGELREALNTLEEQLGTGTRQYDSDDGTMPCQYRPSQCHDIVKTTAVTRVLRSVSSKKKGTRPNEYAIMDLEAEGSVAERVARLLAYHGCRMELGVAPRLRLAKRLPSHLGCLPGLINMQACAVT